MATGGKAATRALISPLTAGDVFRAADLVPHGPVAWGTLPAETAPGVYVVSLLDDPQGCIGLPSADYLSERERERWLPGHPVVYIGRTRRPLARRIREFYRHKHGKTAPHRGGQAVKLLICNLWVFWCPTDEPTHAEHAMIEAFCRHTGRLPFANRRR